MTDKAATFDANTATAVTIMRDFSRLTGLDPHAEHPRRYLWTDAFAVCNFLELWERTRDPSYRDLALRLIDQVHLVLGRHRNDDSRIGWISGLDETMGGLHPTIGGLRIGKPLNERRPGELPDERLEWDRDGQYFHYLTRWMHALACASRVSGDPKYSRWAVELAGAAHAHFTYTPVSGGKKRMYWKMSIDLSRPLIPSMGQHDPLDGYVTYRELQAQSAGCPGQGQPSLLAYEIADMADICRGIYLPTDDPLGTGGLMIDAARIGQLVIGSGCTLENPLLSVLDAAVLGMEAFERSRIVHQPAGYRLAFRESGLSVGLKGAAMLAGLIRESPGAFTAAGILQQKADKLAEYLPLAGSIERFWMDGRNQETSAWQEHREINTVMLATSLLPDEFLRI